MMMMMMLNQNTFIYVNERKAKRERTIERV